MSKILNMSASLLLAAALAMPVVAEEKAAGSVEKVRQSLALLLPDIQIENIAESPVPGLYEVVIGARIIYVTEDGRHLFRGDIIDMEMRANITRPRLNQVKAQAVAKVGEENMVVFGPKEAKHEITVFTDIDCGYCRKLHNEMEAYNSKGIKVRYLFYPRAGVDSDSYRKAVTVWCSEDKNSAMTRAKAGESLPNKECDNPVKDHFALGQTMGVTGTPAIVLKNGEMVPGYVPADRLEMVLRQAGL